MADTGKWEIVRKNPKKTRPNSEILNVKNIGNDKSRNGDTNWLTQKKQERMPRLVQSVSIHESEVMYNVLSNKGSRKTLSKQRVVNVIMDNNNAAADNRLSNGSAVINEVKESKRKVTERPKKVVEKPPKSLEEALRKIQPEELRSMMQMVRMRFPESCNIWLKDLISYLNLKLNVDTGDPTFTGKDSSYPLSAAPKDVRFVIENTIEQCANPSLVSQSFERYLIEMAEDMTNGLRCNGHKLVLQALVRSRPSLVTEALPHFRDLLNSYQNRSTICFALLWVAGVAGTVQFDIGLTVWLELFLPVLGIRTFSKYVVDYLRLLVSLHSDFKGGVSSMGVCNFFPVLDTVFNNTANLPAALHKDLLAVFPKLKAVVFSNKPETNLRNYFPSFLSRLEHSCPPILKAELLKSLVHCLRVDSQCFFRWKQLYTRHLVHSGLLLEHLSERLNSLGANRPLMKKTLDEFGAVNLKLSKSTEKGLPEGLRQCKKYCSEVLAKAEMDVSEDDDQRTEIVRRKASILRPLLFVFCVVLGSAVIYDCQINGSFQASKTSRLLHEYGVFKAYRITASKARLFYGVSRKWVVKNFPLYYATLTKFATPYVKIILAWIFKAWDVVFNLIFEIHMGIVLYGPLIFQMIDSRFPYIFETIMWFIGQAWTIAFQVMAATWTYVGHVADISIVWLYENILVGPLAVDKLQQHMHSAMDHVQSFTIEAFNWIHQQLHSIN